jgi:hypothetical protein
MANELTEFVGIAGLSDPVHFGRPVMTVADTRNRLCADAEMDSDILALHSARSQFHDLSIAVSSVGNASAHDLNVLKHGVSRLALDLQIGANDAERQPAIVSVSDFQYVPASPVFPLLLTVDRAHSEAFTNRLQNADLAVGDGDVDATETTRRRLNADVSLAVNEPGQICGEGFVRKRVNVQCSAPFTTAIIPQYTQSCGSDAVTVNVAEYLGRNLLAAMKGATDA